jgi:hypothetical protein
LIRFIFNPAKPLNIHLLHIPVAIDKKKALQEKPVKPYFFNGAGGRGRTGMAAKPLDFESSTSTNFITPAKRISNIL